MKKVICLFIILAMLLGVIGCGSADTASQSCDVTNTYEEEYKPYSVKSVTVSIESFTQDIVIDYNSQAITVTAPVFTGIPSASVNGYKSYYWCQNGYYIFTVSTVDGEKQYKVDKSGTILDKNCTESREFPRERPIIYNSDSNYTYAGKKGRIRILFMRIKR